MPLFKSNILSEWSCVDCGYDLRATPSLRCPECGRANTKDEMAVRNSYGRQVDRTVMGCCIIPPAILTCAIGAMALADLMDFHVLDDVGALLATITLMPAFLISAVIAASVLTQHELVGERQPKVFKMYPIRATLVYSGSVLIYVFAQAVTTILFCGLIGITIALIIAIYFAIRILLTG